MLKSFSVFIKKFANRSWHDSPLKKSDHFLLLCLNSVCSVFRKTLKIAKCSVTSSFKFTFVYIDWMLVFTT